MSLNDKIITRNESFYQDEFERLQASRSMVLAFYWANLLSMALAPILAWSLTGKAAYLSFLALIPVSIGQRIGQQWLKKTVARPRVKNLKYLWTPEYLWTAAVIIAWIAGLSRNASAAFGTGSFVGAFVGAIVVILLTPVITSWYRKRDLKRLDAEAED